MNTFHGFTLGHKIGAGGMSTVFMGHHSTLGYPVAIKVLHPSLSGDDEFIARFEREARAASSLNHDNIVNVIDFGSENDIFFIVMPYIDGADLGKVFNEVVIEREGARFPLEIALPILQEVAYGLQVAHKQGIIHRDVKPSNVLLSSTGFVKLTDFGLARDVDGVNWQSAQDLTMPSRVVGTPSYMAPEQAAGGKVDVRTDIFSLGVMAFQLIIGHKPFTGKSIADVQEQIINAEMPQLGVENCPRYTPEIGHLLAKMLAKDPARRFQSMDQVLRALTAALESIDVNGNVLKHKREYMARFAEAPAAFSDELQTLAIDGYLKRGFYFKNLGLSSIGDAVREFTFVLSLDANHPRAGNELQELRKKAEESGVMLVPASSPPKPEPSAPRTAGSDETKVFAAAPAPPPPPPPRDAVVPPPPPKHPPAPQAQHATAKRPTTKYVGIAAALVLAALAAVAIFWPRSSGSDRSGAAPSTRDHAVATLDRDTSAALADRGHPADTPADSGVNVAAAAASAQTAMLAARDARAAGDYDDVPAAAAIFQRAGNLAENATRSFAQGQYDTALQGFTSAEGLYADAARALDGAEATRSRLVAEAASKRIAESKTGAAASRDAMTRARAAADRAGDAATASAEYRRARDLADQAEALLSQESTDAYRRADKLFAQATSGFDSAAARAAAAGEASRARDKAGAEAARKSMDGARKALAPYPADSRSRSPKYGEAESAAVAGDRAFAKKDYELAQHRYGAAADLYHAAAGELQLATAANDDRAARAEITDLVESFFASIAKGDYQRFKSILHWSDAQDENWRELIESAASLQDRHSEILLGDDHESATVTLTASLYYKNGSRVSSDPYRLAFTWKLRAVDGEWSVVDVQLE